MPYAVDMRPDKKARWTSIGEECSAHIGQRAPIALRGNK